MGQSAEKAAKLAIILLGFATAGFWGLPHHPDLTVWLFRFAVPLAAVALAGLLFYAPRRPDLLPDKLREIIPKPFERDGLCFGFLIVERGGVCWIDLHVQNRYAKECVARILFRPQRPLVGHPAPIEPLDVRLSCDGGATSVYSRPIAVPPSAQGTRVTFEVAAATRFPAGRGRLLRFRGGLSVGSLPGNVDLLVATGLAAGFIVIRKPARATLQLPLNVAATVPPGLEPTYECLWQPEFPTRAFQVQTTEEPH